MSDYEATAKHNAETAAGVVYALLACRDELQRIADALEAPRREPSYLPDREAAAPELPDLELLAEAANDARILAQHRGDEADAQKYNALWRQLAGVRVGVTGEPPREEEIDRRCGAVLLKQGTKPGVLAAADANIEAVCFLQQGHHGSHRSDRGHIWS